MPFSYTKDLHPYYFGHFVNQARHNAYLVIVDIMRRHTPHDDIPNEEENLPNISLLNRLTDREIRPDEKRRLAADLMNHFTFLRYLAMDSTSETLIAEVDVKKMAIVLRSAFTILNRLRNKYSHSQRLEEDTFWRMNDNSPFPLQDIYNTAVMLLHPRYEYYTEEHLKALRATPANAAHTPNDPSKEPYNERALVFFICLFLQRDEISRFVSRLEGFRSSAEFSRRAFLDAYREMSCKLPQDKLESSDILLDMINELARCPKVLFRLLGEKDRQKFITPSELTDEEGIEEGDIPPGTRIRHNDRFPWFALRYFDDNEVFASLRFHIHLGKFAQDRYPKEMYFSQRERVLHHPIRIFSRWNSVDVTNLNRKLSALNRSEKDCATELEKTLPESWLVKHQGLSKLRPEIEQFSTSYLLQSNTIGFRFLNTETEKDGFPPFETHTDGKGRLKFLSPNPEPDGIISTYELAPLFLHQRLHGAAQTEAYIRDYIEKFRLFCRDMENGNITPFFADKKVHKYSEKVRKTAFKSNKIIQNDALRDQRAAAADRLLFEQYGLRLKNIPDYYRTYLLGYREDSYRDIAFSKLKEKRRETKQLLKDIGLTDNNTEQPEYRNLKYAPKAGNMAVFLTSDLIFFKRYTPDKGGKPNNDEYIILEAALAYFGADRQRVKKYLIELGFLEHTDRSTSHSFLEKVNFERCEGIFDFYEKYLLARLNFLDAALRDINPNFGRPPSKKAKKDGIPDSLIKEKYGHFLRIDEKKVEERRYSSTPVFLPKGFFNIQNEKTLSEQSGRQGSTDSKPLNTIALLSAYYNRDTNSQPMYKWDREILPPGKSGERGTSIAIKEYLNHLTQELNNKEQKDRNKLQRQRKHILDMEQEIRYTRAMDQVLWMMVLERAQKNRDWHFTTTNNFSLNDIDNILTQEITFHLERDNVVINDQLTIRRYGELRKVMKDRRLDKMLEYFQQSGVHIDHNDIKDAFALFERRRIPFFERIFKFELAIEHRFPESVQNHYERNGRKTISHWGYLNPASEQIPDFERVIGISKDNLGEARNSLMHNEFPSPDILPVASTATCTALVDQIFDTVEGYYNSIIAKLGMPPITLAASSH